MDWYALAAAATGAILGGGCAFALSGAMRELGLLVALRAGLVVLAMAAGAAGGLSLFDAAGGRSLSAPSAVESEMAAELYAHGYVRRVFEDFPEREREIRARAQAAFAGEGAGAGAAHALIAEAAIEIGAFAVQHYVPRARDGDLLRFITAIVRIFRHLEGRDPMRCYRWIVAQPAPQGDTLDDLAAAIGQARIDEYQAAVDAMATRASREVLPYDTSRAEAVVTLVGQEIIARDGVEALAFLAGQRPVSTDEDAKRACRAAADMYERITRFPAGEAAAALRHVLSPVEAPE